VERASGRVSELSRAGRAPEDVQEPVDLAIALLELHKRVASAARLSGTEIRWNAHAGLRCERTPSRCAARRERGGQRAGGAATERTGGRLAVRARQADGVVELTVEDNGPGSRPCPSRLFVPFASGRKHGARAGHRRALAGPAGAS